MVESIHTNRYRMLTSILIEARKSKGYSQAELAEKLEKVQTYVSKFERGERRLDVVEFLDVATALQIDALKVLRKIQSTEEP